jgi:hypothetical protein
MIPPTITYYSTDDDNQKHYYVKSASGSLLINIPAFKHSNRRKCYKHEIVSLED